jgi:esterase/lipase
MFRKIFLWIFAFAMVLAIVYMLGPKVDKEELVIEYPEIPTRMPEIEEYLVQREDTVQGLKPDNEAYIVWADSTNKRKTPYSIVYIHGFGASPMEGDPVHRFLAAHFGANLFVTRLPEHGIKRDNGLEYLTAQKLALAAGEAYQIGKSLGDSVIVVGASMGGALTLLLASQQPDIKALVIYSPAIRDNGERLSILFTPWLKKFFEWFGMDNKVIHQKREGDKAKYWSEEYHINGYQSLGVLMYSMMNKETFNKIKQPLFLGYYYKNEKEQDNVVVVSEMLTMFDQLGTSEKLKRKEAFPESGDHLIHSSIASEDWESVLFSTIDFLENVANVPSRADFQQKIHELSELEKELSDIK